METLYDRPDVRAALRALEAEECQAFARLLSPRESVVLHGRFLGHPPRSWGSLARALSVAQERVRQMEAEIIKKFDAWKSPH
jgi:DNA-directed RNA polymerase sigma subunit (sigma70/sigma32)